jgi:hypothetical protein
MTLSKLGTLFYYAYTLKSEPVSQEIIKLNAKSILSSLGSEWKVAPIHAQLKEAASKSSAKGEVRMQAMAVTEVKRRGKASMSRKTVSGNDGASGRRESRPDSERDQSPEPHASKSLLPPHGGRRSGKVAGLRLASAPAMKRAALDRDAESPDEDGSRPRKRRRPSPPEMGDDSDSASPPPILSNSFRISPSDSETGEEEDDESSSPLLHDEPIISLKMVTESLPTLSPSGPNGAWTCDRQDCPFTVHDAELEEGREKIRAHFTEHADRLQREALVRQEAAPRRLPIDHLLEKLRGLGESARMGGLAEMIGERLVPETIKRERGMAI